MATAFYYIHGFNSGFDPNNGKIKALEELGTVHGRTTNYLDSADVERLVWAVTGRATEVEKHGDELIVVGTSLGGYMARYVGDQLGLRTILINPSMTPATTLKKCIGWPLENFVTGDILTVTDSMVDELKSYEVAHDTTDCLCILATDDEVVDYRIAEAILKDSCKIVHTTGGHRLESVNKLHAEIVRFINTPPAHGS